MKEISGFTLIELMIVLAIIVILASIVVGGGGGITSGEGERVGKVVKLSHRGLLWKTWEGQMILGDRGAVTQGTWDFSISDSAVCQAVKEAMEKQELIRLSYTQNAIIRPWSGSTTYFITSVTPIKSNSESAETDSK